MASKKQKSRSAFSYLRLLVAVDPKPLDFILLLFGVSASIGAGVPFPIMALLFGQLVDQLNGASCSNSNEQDSASDMQSNAAISSKVLLTVYVAIANFILIYVATGSWTMFGERLVRRLRYAYLRSLLQQEVAFFETCPAGEVARRLDGDLTTIQSGVSEKVGIVVQSLSYFCTAYIVSFTLDAPLTGMLVSLIPAYLLMTYLGGRLSTKYRGQVEKRLAPAIAVASESMANMKLIKAFHAGSKVQSMFNKHLATTHRPALGKLVVAAVQMGLLYFIAYSANALAISQGGRQIADSISSGSGITLGAVYTVMMTLVDASYIISQVAPFATIFAAASEASTKILDTINRTPEIDSSRNGQGHVMAKVQGRVEFHDVVFSYPSRPDIKVHDKLSLTIPAGKMTGIVGGSGCGKSTIATLTQRFYDPAQGKILVDGLDVRDIQLRSLRGQIGYVEQNPVLFDRSILENIAHGLIGSSQPEHAALHELLVGGHLSILVKKVLQGGHLEELASHHSQLQRIVSLIKLAATQAGLDDFLAKSPHGLAAPVGTGGGELSGGQKQRVALARTLVRDPAIIILDEATAALDSTTEAQIMESIHNLPGKRTIICVAHRLSTVKNADNILVMGPGGKIIEEGGYTELVNLGSVFASMVKSQAIVLEEENTRQADEGKVDTSSSRPRDPEKHVASDELSSENTPTSTTTESTTKPIAKVNNLSIFLRLLRLDRARHRVLSLVGLFASVVVGGAHAGEAVIFGNAVGNLASCRSSHAVRSSASLYGLLFFLLALVEFLANTVSASCFGYVSDRLVNNFRQFTLEALLRRDLEWHEAGDRTPGSLISYFTADATNMSGLTGVILGVTVSVSVTLIGGIILANVVAWKISLVLTACVPLIFVSGFLRLRLQARFAARHAKAFSSSVSTASEGVTHIKTVAAFSLQDEVLNTFQRSLDEPYKATLKSIAYGNLWLAGAFSVGSFVKALAFWWGGRLIARGEITQVDFFISLVSLLSAAQTSGQLFSLSPDITKAVVAARRVFGLICPDGRIHHLQLGKPSADDTEKRSSISHGKGAYSDIGVAVSLDNVTFSYSSSPSTPVLRNLSMEIPAGSFIALVGTSGAGKSTIMSLIGALYKPTSGRVMLDGYDIGRRRGKAINEDADTHHEEDEHDPSLPVWDDMALVPQDPTLFSGSVAFNVELGSRQGHVASSAEVEHAARLANIHDMVKDLPDGYDTLCGPMGSQVFSGGQKQRLCIARALLRKPRLLLLDEPSSAMDTESERLFEETLENLMQLNDQGHRRVTVVTIAHRLRTVIKADKIFVIEHGEILDAGTHTELVGRCAKYREDVVHQTLS